MDSHQAGELHRRAHEPKRVGDDYGSKRSWQSKRIIEDVEAVQADCGSRVLPEREALQAPFTQSVFLTS